jgi:hypothetical protein
MIKKTIAVGLLMALVSSANAFELKVPKLGADDKGAASSGNVEADVASFIAKSAEMRDIAYVSMTTIVAAYADEAQLAKMKAENEALLKQTDTKENNALKMKLIKSREAELAELEKQKDIGEKTKALSAEKQKNVAKGVYSFFIAVLNAPVLLDKGQKIVSSVSLTNVMKVLPVKDSLPMLTDFVKYGAGTVGGFAKILKGANIEVKTPTVESKPETNTSDMFPVS